MLVATKRHKPEHSEQHGQLASIEFHWHMLVYSAESAILVGLVPGYHVQVNNQEDTQP